MPQAISSLVEAWRSQNTFIVEPLEVRSVKDAYEIFIEGRKNTDVMWFEVRIQWILY